MFLYILAVTLFILMVVNNWYIIMVRECTVIVHITIPSP